MPFIQELNLADGRFSMPAEQPRNVSPSTIEHVFTFFFIFFSMKTIK